MGTGKSQGRFDMALRRGSYLFHVHTDWTDGQSSLADYCLSAKRLGFKSVILTEHVRRKPTYDFRMFLGLAKEQQAVYNIPIIVGVEAKVLPEGTVDIPETILSEIEVLGIAEHSFDGDSRALAKALKGAFDHFSNAPFAVVWVHPGLGLLRKSVPERLLEELLQTALEKGVYIEINLRHRLPPESLLPLIPDSALVIGLDAHTVTDVEVYCEEAFYREKQLKDVVPAKRKCT